VCDDMIAFIENRAHNLGELGLRIKIILKWTLKQWNLRLWAGSVWCRLRSNDRHFGRGNESSDFVKDRKYLNCVSSYQISNQIYALFT
jgi:hypothetical protein